MTKETIRNWIRKIGEETPRLAEFLLLAVYVLPRYYIFMARSSNLIQHVTRRIWHIRSGPLAGFKLTGLLPDEIAPVLSNRMEIRCSNLLQSLPLKSQTVLDVGGSYGYYALLFSRLVGEEGHVYTFEPDWRSFERLTHNLPLNNIENVSAVPICASNVAMSLAPWSSFEDEPWNSRLVDGRVDGGSQRLTAVPVARLDDFAEQLGILEKIRLIKIDVEGAELKVLEGAIRLLEQSKPLVLCELHGTEIAQQVFVFLSERGYQHELVEYMNETRQHILAFPRIEAENVRGLILSTLQ